MALPMQVGVRGDDHLVIREPFFDQLLRPPHDLVACKQFEGQEEERASRDLLGQIMIGGTARIGPRIGRFRLEGCSEPRLPVVKLAAKCVRVVEGLARTRIAPLIVVVIADRLRLPDVPHSGYSVSGRAV